MYVGTATTYHGPSGQARSQIIPPSRNHNLLNFKNTKCREFPGGPVVGTPHFHLWEPRLDS